MRLPFIATMLLFLCLVQSVCAQRKKLEIKQLTGNFYIYTTYKDYDGLPFPSNGMYLVAEDGVVLFDTPWDSTQFQPLLDSIAARHDHEVVMCISTHFHDDRTAGLEYYSKKGIATFSSKQTYDLCVKNGKPKAANYFTHDTVFKVCRYRFETFYPGAGHSPDNIVVWVPYEKILYGGCFVKSTENSDLGNLSDANVKEWPKSVLRVMKRCPDPNYVIPGHFGWDNPKSLNHTLKLLQKAQKN